MLCSGFPGSENVPTAGSTPVTDEIAQLHAALLAQTKENSRSLQEPSHSVSSSGGNVLHKHPKPRKPLVTSSVVTTTAPSPHTLTSVAIVEQAMLQQDKRRLIMRVWCVVCDAVMLRVAWMCCSCLTNGLCGVVVLRSPAAEHSHLIYMRNHLLVPSNSLSFTCIMGIRQVRIVDGISVSSVACQLCGCTCSGSVLILYQLQWILDSTACSSSTLPYVILLH